MDRVEEQLRETLRGVSTEAGEPLRLKPARVRRIRGLRIIYSSLTLLVLGGVIGGMLLGFSLRTKPPPVVAPSASQRVYVIDDAPNGKASRGNVAVVDVRATGSTVVDHYPVGSDSEVVLSPDGTRLYSVSFVWVSHYKVVGRLQVFDTTTGRLIQRTPLRNWHGTTGAHLGNQIAISPDGSRVLVIVSGPAPGLATYDATTGKLLPEVAPLDDCGSPTILPESSLDLVVVCRTTNEVRFLRFSDSGGITGEARLTLPTGSGPPTTDFVSQAVLSPDGGTLYAVDRDGFVSVIDVQAQTVRRTVQLQLPREGAETDVVAMPQVALTPDGHELLLGASFFPGNVLRADILLAFDTATWKEVGRVATVPFTAFIVSRDGRSIFTIDYDSPELQEVEIPPESGARTLGNVATRPDALYFAP